MDRNPNSTTSETERNIDIAAKLLSARDLIGAKRFADLSLSSSSLSDVRSDQILAVTDVLLAAQNLPLNYYSILQVPANNFDLSILKRNYRRLSQLLHPDCNPLFGADTAFSHINDAFAVLSDPEKKSEFDLQFFPQPGKADAFWTLCQYCCHVHLYARVYLNKMLKCQSCLKGFSAVELGSLPSVVPGTDMYYATWGFLPMGFANPKETKVWKPFVSMNQNVNQNVNQNANGMQPPGGASGGVENGGKGPMGRKKKTVAKKKGKSGVKGRVFGSGENDDANGSDGSREEERARGININEAARGAGEEDINMIIDLDATDYMFSSLQNLPFMPHVGMNMQMPHVGNGGF